MIPVLWWRSSHATTATTSDAPPSWSIINSHTAAVQKLGLDNEALAEVLAVVGLYNQMNKLADAYQVEPDILPEPR